MTSTETTDRKIPNPVYAAAGVGDLAYQQLRRLPDRVGQLREKVTELRARADRDELVDVEKIRASAKRNAAALRTSALVAQDKATALYADLVARGQSVVGTGRTVASDQVERVAELTSDAAVAIAPEPEPVPPAADEPDTAPKARKAAPKK